MRWIAMAALAAWSAAGAVAADSVPAAPELTAEQIVEKNQVARGGVEAWRKIETMVWVGHMESQGGPVQQVPFVLQQKRPNKTRFELNAMGQRTLRVFDGKRGWKARPGRDGSPDVQPFSPQELRFAQEQLVIDGPLMDSNTKRVAVELDGVDQVEGRKAYRLIVRTASGQRHNVWVDAQTFLDIKYDRTSYNAAGVPATVSVFFRDYRNVDGLQIPGTIETGVGSGKAPDRMVIEKVALNPTLDDRMFARPGAPSRRHMVTIDPPPDSAAGSVPIRPSTPPPATAPDPGTAPK
jgi:outer membrane lipoprotein-sorting protein